ncbi:TPA: hypothetical protein ACVGJS_006501 [Pseudomonas aeruginosa]
MVIALANWRTKQMIGVLSDAMAAVVAHDNANSKRMRGWVADQVEGMPALVSLVYQDSGEVRGEVVWLDRTGVADLELVVSYLNNRIGAGSHTIAALTNLYCSGRPIDVIGKAARTMH